MAPELFQDAEHDIKTDLWSLGCVMYEMYTGMASLQTAELLRLINL